MRRRLARGATRNAIIGAACAMLAAHVGSPNVFFVGKAGPYDVTVVVRPPQVVPGLADITVRVPADQSADLKRVVVRPVYWATGTRGSPAGDEAKRVAAAEPTYTAKLWFMQGGSYSVYVNVEGARGSGTVTVPVASVAIAQLTLSPMLKVLLVILGLVLFFGMLTIVRGAAGESLVPPGEEPDAKRRRGARLATAVALPLLTLIVVGGWRWWVSEAEDYRRTLARPLAVASSVRDEGGVQRFRLEITDSAWRQRRFTPLLPDQGKMMHLFLIKDSTLDAFTHLHPAMVDSNSFEAVLPPLPAGRYRVYGDVVHESGYERTLVSTVTIAASGGASRAADPDDSFDTEGKSATLGAGTPAAAPLAGGLRLMGEPSRALVAGQPLELAFRLVDAGGAPTAIEPYLGMPAHAVVTRRDGAVFIHLHPMGTISPASQAAFALRERGDTTAKGRLDQHALAAADAAAMTMGAPDGRVRFTYEFPKPGAYRLWVQVKHGGKVLTGTFDADVRQADATK